MPTFGTFSTPISFVLIITFSVLSFDFPFHSCRCTCTPSFFVFSSPFFFLYHLRFSLASPPPLRANYIYSFVSVQYPSALLTSLRNFVCPFSAVLLSCSLACLLLNLIVIFLVSLAFLFRCGRRFISLRLCLVCICCLTSLCCQLFSVILLYIYVYPISTACFVGGTRHALVNVCIIFFLLSEVIFHSRVYWSLSCDHGQHFGIMLM